MTKVSHRRPTKNRSPHFYFIARYLSSLTLTGRCNSVENYISLRKIGFARGSLYAATTLSMHGSSSSYHLCCRCLFHVCSHVSSVHRIISFLFLSNIHSTDSDLNTRPNQIRTWSRFVTSTSRWSPVYGRTPIIDALLWQGGQ